MKKVHHGTNHYSLILKSKPFFDHVFLSFVLLCILECNNHACITTYSLIPMHSALTSPFHTDTSEPTDSRPIHTITTVITALTSVVAVFGCGLLLAAVCYCVIMLAKSKHKKESKVSECSRFSTSGPTATL